MRQHSVSSMIGVLAAVREPELFAQLVPLAPFLSDHRADLAGVSVPTLVLQCSRDAIAPLEVGAFVHAAVADSTPVTLDATGHCPQLDSFGDGLDDDTALLALSVPARPADGEPR
ncbi:pimeloyl-ACP methyl ester carboxylesterase [Catenulispora sp. MAP12-49]